MICQLQCLEEAVTEISRFEKLPRLVLRNSLRVFRRVMGTMGLSDLSGSSGNRGHSPNGEKKSEGNKMKSAKTVVSKQSLKAGDRVRVKSLEQIMKTLDGENKFQGLAFTPVMEEYCEGTYTVLKKVDRIFDERKWKLSKIKNVILLDGVFCNGCGGIEKDWDGCDRTCYIWWKEGWVEALAE